MTGFAYALASLLVGLGIGVVVGYRRGVRASWLAAATAFVNADRIVFRQLRRAEESARVATEQVHELLHDPRAWRDNGAGYRSGRYSDSPARPVGVTPREINEDAKAG